MLFEVTRASNSLVPAIIALGLLGFIGFVVWAVTRRTIEPWWRKYPKPGKQKKIARDIIAAYREREKCPQAFDPNDKLYQPLPVQHIPAEEVTKIAEEVVRVLGATQKEEQHVD